MKHIYATFRTFLSRPVRFRLFIAGPIVLFSMIFTLFLSGGRVVEADAGLGDVPTGTSPFAGANFSTEISPFSVAAGDLNRGNSPPSLWSWPDSTAPGALITVTGTPDGTLATLALNTTCDLREAVTAANTNAAVGQCAAGTVGLDTIAFAIPGAGVKTITLTTANLPNITGAVIIDGTTQGVSATPLIEINANSTEGFFITTSGCTVKGFAMNRCNGCVNVNGANTIGTVIQGNYLGTDPTGMFVPGTDFGNGIVIDNAKNTIIGGTTSATRNVLSGNKLKGIIIIGSGATGTVIQGNYIGTNAAGTAALANGEQGITQVAGTSTIGGTSAGAGNLISGNVRQGIEIGGGTSIVQGNLIGTNVNGIAAIGNLDGVVMLNGGAQNNVIGGTTAAERNIISGNQRHGVLLDNNTSGNRIQGNYIGTDVTGTADLGNTSNGVEINFAPGNIIGGSATGAGNLISGNNGDGIFIRGSAATNNLIQGNLIGTKANGTDVLGNAGDGIDFRSDFSASNNTIGGISSGEANIVAFNGTRGVFVSGGTGNRILSNSIFSNAGLGIDLSPAGVTPNDAGDPDTGPNNLQNFPVLTSAITGGGSTTIQGTLNSTAGTAFRIEFFSNLACDPSGNGEGQTFLGSTSVTTAGNNATINVVLPVAVTPGQFVTSTATDPGGNTSEFSACVLANGIAPTPTPTPTPAISISVGTIPTGRSFTVDGTTYATAQNFTWVSGSLHNIATTTPQQTAGARYDWSSWSDGGAISHNVSPTAATNYVANFTANDVTVSGRIVTSDFRGLRNTTVSMTDPNGVVRTATTSSFGYFSFSNVTTGVRYVFRVQSRLFRYAPVSATITDEITLPDFVGLE